VNIIERAKAFVQSLRELSGRSAWDWRRCPCCGGTDTCKYGSYERNPWSFGGRQKVRVQRHKCNPCNGTYSERSVLLVRGSWYAREVHRAAIDYWQYGGNSLRRAVDLLCAHMNRQGRWLIWRPLDPEPAEKCRLGAGTVERWLDRAGKAAQRTVEKQLDGVPSSGQMGTDGLWAVLRGGTKRVVLALVDGVTGVVWPPVVVEGEEDEKSWAKLFERAKRAGLDPDVLRGITSDGAKGLIGYLNKALEWVNHQRCVFHIWRNLSGELAKRASEAAIGLAGKAAKAAREQARRGRRQERSGSRRSLVEACCTSAGRWVSGDAEAGPREAAGLPVAVQQRAGAGGAGMALAGLSAQAKPWAQPRVGRAAGAGGPGVGDLS